GTGPENVPRSVELGRRFRWWPIAAGLLLAFGVVVVMHRVRRPTPAVDIVSNNSPSPQPRAFASPAFVPQSTAPPTRRPGRVVRVQIPRVTTEPVDVDLRSRAQSVRFEVPVDDRQPSYDVKVQTANGKEIWRGEGLT